MSDDIVERLRRFDEGEFLCGLGRDFDGGKLFYGLCLEASNEIERLRELSGDAGQLREERDEARWTLCKVVGDNRGVWGCEIAKENGWDYLATEAKP